MMPELAQPDVSAFETQRIGSTLKVIENRFLLPTGPIDLLEMATQLQPHEFRFWINLSREWRHRTRKQ